MQKDFTKEEALSKVGKIVQTRIPFFGLPQGTRGKVLWADLQLYSPLEGGPPRATWHVVIEWQRWERPGYIPVPSFRDWLTKALYEKIISEET